MSSQIWINKSKAFIRNVGHCVLCNRTTNLGSHHKTYENFGHESQKDIMVLCWDCHNKLHKNKNYVIKECKGKIKVINKGSKDIIVKKGKYKGMTEYEANRLWRQSKQIHKSNVYGFENTKKRKRNK